MRVWFVFLQMYVTILSTYSMEVCCFSYSFVFFFFDCWPCRFVSPLSPAPPPILRFAVEVWHAATARAKSSITAISRDSISNAGSTSSSISTSREEDEEDEEVENAADAAMSWLFTNEGGGAEEEEEDGKKAEEEEEEGPLLPCTPPPPPSKNPRGF